jgi:hypothetical protein
LIGRATRWLRISRSCGVVLTRGSVCVSEQPDAIGWRGNGESMLIECKASRSDFFRDAEKECRQLAAINPACGLGNLRYFLTRPALVSFSEIPVRWGLLEAYDGRIRERKPAERVGKNQMAEISLLLAALRHGSQLPPVVLEHHCLPDVGL